MQKTLISDLEAQLIVAMQNSDVAALDALIHPDLQFVLPNGHTVTKEEDLNAHRSGTMSITELKAGTPAIKLLGDTATVTVEVQLAGTFFEQAFGGTFRYLRIWQKSGDAWQVIAGCSTPIQG